MKPVRVGVAAALVVLAALASAGPSGSQTPHTNDTCLECHSTEGMTGTNAAGQEVSIYVHPDSFATSVHGAFACVDCHADLATAEMPHNDVVALVDCSGCHADEVAKVAASDHGKYRGLAGSENCVSCHGNLHRLVASSDSTSLMARNHVPTMCAKCHDGNGSQKAWLADRVHSYARTVHGRSLLEQGNMAAATCTDCHSAHDIYKPSNPQSTLHRTKIASMCGQCHGDVAEVYGVSIHGRAMDDGMLESATCTDCHGEHTILGHKDPGSSVFATAVSDETCASCHGAARLARRLGLPAQNVASYRESYHGLAVESGATTAANCASCHGVHDILPSSDPKSSIHPDNLARTCGKCHPGVSGASLTGLKIHAQPGDQPLITRIAKLFYVWLIPLTIGGMFLHHFLDWLRKVRRHMARERARRAPVRWERPDQVEHLVLLVSFIALAYSGFAIKFPGEWWGAPFNWLGGETFRRWFHRGFAIVFFGLSLVHTIRVIVTPRGRQILREMMFRLSDIRDLKDFVSGRRQSLPESHDPRGFTYIAKAEYWALVWGTLVMTATGALLAFNDWMLANLPLWVPDFATLVHYYEAVLATLAILVWHFYPVLFDPAIAPVNLSMATGKACEEVSEHMAEEKPAPPGAGESPGPADPGRS